MFVCMSESVCVHERSLKEKKPSQNNTNVHEGFWFESAVYRNVTVGNILSVP